ncbi:MAG TPA: bifunctional homocysteine S-methyltransferase/methylenetetrahydrofolate reductase [Gaiellaceae bacterium]|nr:bifunctional homocysteine S-methyltransferase/methylenetetrahydrofolate reductase [Gaiellaceae bacterium]
MPRSFEQRLETGPIVVADGGMGVLVSGAVPRVRCPEEANIRAPEAVVSLHVSFINAGADLIETNTFGANRRKLASHFLEDEVEKINSSGVKLAREAREISGRDVFIGGSIGPLGEHTGDLAHDYRARIFREQAAALDARGVDLFVVETFFELDELRVAIEAVREVSSLPIVAMLTFDEQGETLGGVSAKNATEALADSGLAAIGANHGAGIHAALTALNEMHATNGDLALAAMPNIGLASLAGNRLVFPHATPQYFADFAAHARDLGARIIGGCCGTTPVEIEAIAAAVASERTASSPLVVHEREVVLSVVGAPEETRLGRMLEEGEWVVSVQLDPPLGGNHRGMLEVAKGLEDGGAAIVDINDNATARAGMSALMLSVAIERTTGVETIPHLTTRDSSVLGLESQLLGAHAEGIRNVLAVTGDPPEVGDYPGSRGVYEVDSIGLVQLMAHLNRGEDYNGRAIDAATSFHIGVAVNPSADDLDLELERYRRKIEAGAHYAMTQILFDLEYLDRFLDRLGGESPIPMLIGIFPVWSHPLALRLHNEVPGIIVPESVQEALREAGPDGPQVGMEIAQELIEASRDRAAGVYLVAPFRRPLGVLELLTHAVAG